MRRNIMKKFSLLISFLVFIVVSCNEVVFTETEYITGDSVLSIKTDPPVTFPGDLVAISVAVDDGRGTEPVVDIFAGNIVFAGKSSVELNIPKDISTLFGDSAAADLKNNGFADVPVEIKIRNSTVSALKILRIVKATEEPSNFASNPEISKLEYEVVGSAQKIEVEKGSTVFFAPSNVPKEVSFIPEKTVIDDIVKNEYSFSWHICGTSAELPQITEFDELTGKIFVNFRDSDGASLIGIYKFFAVLKPLKSYAGTDSARYGSDFFSFTVDTNGE